MNDEDILARTIVKCVAVIICVIVVTMGSCSMQQNYIIQTTAEHGIDPVRTSCAFASDNGGRILCANTQIKEK